MGFCRAAPTSIRGEICLLRTKRKTGIGAPLSSTASSPTAGTEFRPKGRTQRRLTPRAAPGPTQPSREEQLCEDRRGRAATPAAARTEPEPLGEQGRLRPAGPKDLQTHFVLSRSLLPRAPNGRPGSARTAEPPGWFGAVTSRSCRAVPCPRCGGSAQSGPPSALRTPPREDGGASASASLLAASFPSPRAPRRSPAPRSTLSATRASLASFLGSPFWAKGELKAIFTMAPTPLNAAPLRSLRPKGAEPAAEPRPPRGSAHCRG